MGSQIETNSKVNPVKVPLETDQGIMESEERKWGMPLREVYKHGLAFYKDKEGKAMHLSYEDRLKLVAYTQQTAHGPLDAATAPPLGVLDVIGRDRRAAWLALGDISQVQAMAGFIHTLDRLCPLFKPYLEAIQKDFEDKRQQELKRQQEERARAQLQERVMEEQQKQNGDDLTEEEQVRKIKDALNAQTYSQFLAYAQQQFPGNFEQQALLVRQLQRQHYTQYVRQLALDQRLKHATIPDSEETESTEAKEETVKDCNLNDTGIVDTANTKLLQTPEKYNVSDYADESRGEESDTDDVFPPVEEARMWTSREITPFKASARESGGTLTVAHGETLTVRVPTHPRARCLCWEFATDYYDIGFGLYFEWSKSPTTEVTIHVSDSDDDDDDGDEDGYGDYSNEGLEGGRADAEAGGERRALRGAGGVGGAGGGGSQRPPVSAIVPIYRRDCHNEVYAGTHSYPGEGVYLLKFDNTYSLWRSKTLYYKVYYTQ